MADETAYAMDWPQVDRATRLDCCRLWNRIWPKAGIDSAEDRLAAAESLFTDNAHRWRHHRLHYVTIDGTVVATARGFIAEIRAEGRDFPVQALASVCSAPDCRGHGWPTRLVRAVWQERPADIAVCLFQTGVPEFYRRLGAAVCDAAFVNHADDQEAFWETHAMRYPSEAPWPWRLVDLRGRGW